MEKAVIYARFSSHSQTEQSIEGQLRVCKEYAERNNIEILYEYIDRATTGTNDNRPEFQKMITDAEKHCFNYILVYKLDRFSRNKYDSVVYKHKLNQNGVKVLSATESISDTPEGALMEGLLEMFAEMYSKDLSQKVKRGIRESLIKGNYIGGPILYGYKVEDKKIVIDERTAPAIRYMFEEYSNGKSKKQIMKELYEKGYRTNQGTPLTYNSLQNNLSNKKYIGIYDNGKIRNENYYPPIISKELFEKVQLKLAQHKHAPATQKAKTEYLLTGKIFCGHCGSAMVGVSGTGKALKTYNYYACSKRIKEHKCNKKNEQKDTLERFIVQQTINNVLQPDKIEKIADKILKHWNNNTISIQIKEYETRLLKIEKELDKCFNLFFNSNNEDLQKRMNEKANSLTLEKLDLQEELKKLKLSKIITHTKEEVIVIISQYLDGDINDINFQRKVVNKFINCIFLYDDKVIIYYNILDKESDRITLEESNEILEDNGVRILHTMLRQDRPKSNISFGLGYFLNNYCDVRRKYGIN